MSEILKELQLAVWTPGESLDLPVLSLFTLPADAQRALEEATRRSLGRPSEPTLPSLAGLAEILAWFVPTMAFMRMDWDPDVRMKRLRVYFLGDRSQDAAVHTGLRAGLASWLAVAHGEVPVAIRQAVAKAPSDSSHWSVHRVSRENVYPGICPVPSDRLIFEALVAKAVDTVRTASFSLGQHHGRSLVPRILRKRPVGGLELVVFPPIKEDHDAFWTEVVTLRAATFPERREVHLLARASVRNWGPVKSTDAWDGPARSLDLFMPAGETNLFASVSFAFSSHRDGKGKDAPIRGWWKHQKDRRVFDLIQRLTGNARLGDREVTSPHHDPSGLWVLPRRAPGSRDRFLVGGSGVGWMDRAAIADVLNEHLTAAGFDRAASMRRHTGKLPIERPFARHREPDAESEGARRAALLRALTAIGATEGTLELLVLHVRDETPALVRGALCKYLGQPAGDDPDSLKWGDGLRIVLVSAPAGLFAQALPRGTVSPEDRERFNEKQLARVLADRRVQEQARVADEMTIHLRSIRTRPGELGCAVLEMPEALRNDRRSDPYPIARNRLARAGALPQVLLVDEIEDKYESAARDLLRMLGVYPTSDLPLAPAALTILQTNEDQRGGRRQSPVALPVAARTRGGLLECALPDATSGEPEWVPYAMAMRRIIAGEHDGLDRGRTMENRARHEHFVARALEGINALGPAVVLVDGKVRQHVPAFQNGVMRFDELTLGTRTLTLTDLPNLRIVRLGLDPSEQPFHFHRSETKWPSGLFRWESQTRTAYGIKSKPQSVQGKALRATQRSRHDEEAGGGDRAWPRVHAPLEEICVMFQPPSNDAMETAILVDRLRQVHAQYDSATRAPFPLHELQLLARGFTFDREEETEADELAQDDA